MDKTSKFIEVYGESITNKVIEYSLENQDIDFAVPDMAKEIKISKPMVYAAVDELISKGIIEKSRIIGKTQLYKINKENNISKIYIRNFKECIDIVIDENTQMNNLYTQDKKVGVLAVNEKKEKYVKKKK
ncbi:MAG: hypothetical protein V1859_00690 [archaeon]